MERGRESNIGMRVTYEQYNDVCGGGSSSVGQ